MCVYAVCICQLYGILGIIRLNTFFLINWYLKISLIFFDLYICENYHSKEFISFKYYIVYIDVYFKFAFLWILKKKSLEPIKGLQKHWCPACAI